MGGSVNGAVFLQNPLGVQQAVYVGIHRKSGKRPLDDPDEPDKSTHLKEPDGAEGF